MATVKYGSIVTEIKGKIGGQSFQKGYGGKIMKNSQKAMVLKHIWAYRNSDKIKNSYMVVSQSWRALTDDQRSAWNAAGSSFPAYNKFGDTYTPSGYQLFMKCNTFLEGAGLSLIDTPPIPPVYPPADALTFAEPTPALLRMQVPGGLSGGFILVIEATNMISAGARSSRGGYKIVKYATSLVASHVDFLTEYTAIYGVPVVGTRISVRVSYRSSSAGLGCSPLYFTNIVS